MSRLAFDYFVWLDADTMFIRNPVNILEALGRSPIHVPLELNISAMREESEWKGLSTGSLRDLYRQAGILNQVYVCRSAFWIIRREAIDVVYELAFQFVHLARAKSLLVNVDEALGYAMQILCGDPEAHLLKKHAELWGSDDGGCSCGSARDGKPWLWRHPLGGEAVQVNPAIVHLSQAREERFTTPPGI
jgi:hypothetical protein